MPTPPLALTAAQKKYLDELAEQLVANGTPPGPISLADMARAHQQRQKFAQEILAQRTQRSRMVRKVLEPSVWTKIRAAQTRTKLLEQARNASQAAL